MYTPQHCFSFVGTAIAQLTDVSGPEQCDGDVRNTVFSDRTSMVKAARMLLSSVTKVLVLADCIVIKQIISSRNKVRNVCSIQIPFTYAQSERSHLPVTYYTG